ncbi:MAG: membrane protein insertion efficiency factor YidD [Clostridia bacterium]
MIVRILTLPFSLLAILLIDIYRICLSPLIGNGCCYLPSCSYYARQAFCKFDFFTAFYLATRRVARCNPKSHGGTDFLPLNIKGDYKWIC